MSQVDLFPAAAAGPCEHCATLDGDFPWPVICGHCRRVIPDDSGSTAFKPVRLGVFRLEMPTLLAGGKDVGNIVTLCTTHHRRLHTHGQKRFEYELGQKLRPVARRIESGFYAEKKHGQ